METKFAAQYLHARGINADAAFALGVEISADGSYPRGIYRARLGFDTWWNNKLLPDIIEEAIWFPCIDAGGVVQSYSVRAFPELIGKDGEPVKFLASKNGNGYPFIPRSVWEVAGKLNHPLSLTEGPVKALAILQVGGLPIGLCGVWNAVRNDESFGTDLVPVLHDGFQWRGRKVDLMFDGDHATNPSVHQALIRTMIVFHGYGAEAAVVRWSITDGKGIDDYLAGKRGGSIELSKIFAVMREGAVPLPGILKLNDLELVELELVRSQLKSASLEQLCRIAAKPLGVRASTLLEGVLEERARRASKTERLVPNVVPRSLPEVLNAIIEVLNRYVVFFLPEEQPIVIALWIAHGWFFQSSDYTPYLFVFSPAIRSGKTRLFEVLNKLCRSPEFVEGATAAALIRLIDEANPPVFLLDECDTIFSRRSRDPEAENMRRFLNAGFKRGATFARCAFRGKEIIVQRLPAFCPKALAAIGRCLPSSVADRSIPIELERQGKHKAQKMRDRELQADVKLIHDELEVLAANTEFLGTLSKARPVMPEELHDRQQDICEPLLAIADHAGGPWSGKARDALLKLYGREDEEADVHIRLLKDIKHVFDETGTDALLTESLLRGLINVADDAPWADWFEDLLEHSRIQTAGSKLAYHLRGYRIKPTSIRLSGETGTRKGYQRSQFEEIWERYLSPEKNFSQTPDSAGTAGTNLSKSFTEKENAPETLAGTNDTETIQPEQRKLLIEKNDTQKCSGVPAEIHGVEEKIISAAPEQPETRLGHMPPDQMLAAIREVFPNAQTIDDSKSEPKQAPKKCKICGVDFHYSAPEQEFCSIDCLAEHVRRSVSDNPSKKVIDALRQQARASWQRALENADTSEDFVSWLFHFEKRLSQMRGETEFPCFGEWKAMNLWTSNFNSGEQEQWRKEQEDAFWSSALGRLRRRNGDQ